MITKGKILIQVSFKVLDYTYPEKGIL
jgi:hypothetical protein